MMITESGTFCGSVRADNDEIVESQESHVISVFIDGVFFDQRISVVVNDNDCKFCLLNCC